MNKILKSLFIVAASFAIIACNKETPVQVDDNGDAMVELTIIANNPEAQPATRTEMNGTTPYWSVGDAIGVSNGTSTNYKFETEIEDASQIASFKGSTAVSETLYAYYPYTSNGVNDSGAKVDLPTNQSPTVSSFDGAADVMVAKKFTVSEETKVVEGLQFARLGAIVKIVLNDTDNNMATTQYPTTVSLTAESNLTGRVYVDMVNQKLGALYANQSKSVTANYTSETKYAINGSNATYLIVYPQTLAAGSKLTITASTADYSIKKEITLQSGIELLAGKVTTLNIGLSDSHITADSGALLPFIDNMSWANNGSEDATTDISSSISTLSSGLYTSASKAYKGIGGLKLGTSSVNGYIITKELDLSGQFYIAVKGAKWDGDLVVTVDETDVINAPFAEVNYVNIAAGTFTKKSIVKIATSSKRGRLYSVRIKSGEYTPAPVISVTTENPMTVASTGGSNTIEYTISNPTDATLTATSNDTWISNISCTTSGKVTFDVTEQASGASAREGKVTLSYPDADDVVVTINQAAAQGASGTVDNPYTVAQVRAAMDNNNMNSCYVKGTVSSIVYPFSASYGTGTFYISDDGQTTSNQFEAYSVKFFGGNAWVNGNTQISVGDIVVINCAGGVKIFTKDDVSTYENNSDAYLYSMNGTTNETVPTITKTDITGISAQGVTGVTTSITLSDADGWTASVTPDGSIVTAASISGTTITYSVAANAGSARTGSITVTLSKDGRSDAHAIISVDQDGGINSYTINFESETTDYADWTFTNMTSKQTGSIDAHSGTYYGTTGGKATASIVTANRISSPGTLTVFFSKQSTNTTSSTWYIQVSSDGSTWTDVKTQSATSMNKGEWVKVTSDLSSYSNVYVRVYYSGSTAVRNIDDLSLTY